MDFILNLFTERELMIIGVVIGILILGVLILTFVDILSRKKQEHEEIEQMFDEFSEDENKNTIEKLEVTLNNDSDTILTNDKVINDDIEILENTETKKQEELIESIKINENIESTAFIEPLIMDIDDDIKYQDNTNEIVYKEEFEKIENELKNPKSLEDTLTNLEIMEEENAIISYQELLLNTKELTTVNTDTGDEPISLKEILNMYEDNSVIENLDVEKEMSKTSLSDAYKGDFTSSPYLSPILGVENGIEFEKNSSNDLAEIQLENTANLEKLDKEIRKTNEFLSILNDLKKNLD